MSRAVDKAETLRYLGYRQQDMDDRLDKLIDEVLAECAELAVPRSLSGEFPLDEREDRIALMGTTLELTGRDIRSHLAGASDCILLAATLGPGIDRAIQRYGRTDITRSLILDAAATALIEQVCDEQEEALRRNAHSRGGSVNHRFSPGYGDLPLDIQPVLLEVLQAGKRIGLSCTPSCIMLPRKSVSAIMGVFPAASGNRSRQKSCKSCGLRSTCQYRKDGSDCGNIQAD